MKIDIVNRQKELSIKKSSVRKLVQSLLEYLEIDCEEIAIYFVSEQKICALHDRFFNDPSPTDCISFPVDEQTLGEIFVCPKTAVDYASKKGLDPYEEAALYIIHGILHLIGYDDLEAKERRTMRKKEKSCMRHLSSLGISITPASE